MADLLRRNRCKQGRSIGVQWPEQDIVAWAGLDDAARVDDGDAVCDLRLHGQIVCHLDQRGSGLCLLLA